MEAERVLLIPKTDTTFVFLSYPMQLIFKKNKNGKTSRMLFKSEERETSYLKVE
ncbi:MAG: hypothetical protein ACJAYY_000276 [Paraglaciecola sp.]|jgi:hypothetical protein|uniref:hypothetical protein n=1 Tax=Polaribacter sp. TaxID=1920175 RepID=UPI003AD4E6D4